MFFLLFLFLFSIDSTAGELTLWQSFGEHVKEFPVKEVVLSNAVLLAAFAGFRIVQIARDDGWSSERNKRPLDLNSTIYKMVGTTVICSLCNTQNIVILPIFGSLGIICSFGVEKSDGLLKKGGRWIGYGAFWPAIMVSKCYPKVYKEGGTKKVQCLRLGAVLIQRFSVLVWFSFLIYQIPWLWKKMQHIPATNIFTLFYRYGKKKFSTHNS